MFAVSCVLLLCCGLVTVVSSSDERWFTNCDETGAGSVNTNLELTFSGGVTTYTPNKDEGVRLEVKVNGGQLEQFMLFASAGTFEVQQGDERYTVNYDCACDGQNIITRGNYTVLGYAQQFIWFPPTASQGDITFYAVRGSRTTDNVLVIERFPVTTLAYSGSTLPATEVTPFSSMCNTNRQPCHATETAGNYTVGIEASADSFIPNGPAINITVTAPMNTMSELFLFSGISNGHGQGSFDVSNLQNFEHGDDCSRRAGEAYIHSIQPFDPSENRWTFTWTPPDTAEYGPIYFRGVYQANDERMQWLPFILYPAETAHPSVSPTTTPPTPPPTRPPTLSVDDQINICIRREQDAAEEDERPCEAMSYRYQCIYNVIGKKDFSRFLQKLQEVDERCEAVDAEHNCRRRIRGWTCPAQFQPHLIEACFYAKLRRDNNVGIFEDLNCKAIVTLQKCYELAEEFYDERDDQMTAFRRRISSSCEAIRDGCEDLSCKLGDDDIDTQDDDDKDDSNDDDSNDDDSNDDDSNDDDSNNDDSNDGDDDDVAPSPGSDDNDGDDDDNNDGDDIDSTGDEDAEEYDHTSISAAQGNTATYVGAVVIVNALFTVFGY